MVTLQIHRTLTHKPAALIPTARRNYDDGDMKNNNNIINERKQRKEEGGRKENT
jgi:hypothetical protein